MESYFQTTVKGVNNGIVLKDLSGHGYDMVLETPSGIQASPITASGNIFVEGTL